MISSVLNIIDRIIQLLTIRKTNKRKLFIDHIEPLYSEMSVIHKDYLNALRELMNLTDDFKDDELSQDQIQRVIIKYKTVLEPERVKIFTLAKSIKFKKQRKKFPDPIVSFYSICFQYFSSASGDSSFINTEFQAAQMRYSSHYSNLLHQIKKYLLDRKSLSKDSFKILLQDHEQYLTNYWYEISDIYSQLRITSLR